MRVFTYSEARQRLAELLDLARSEDVQIRRRDGSVFVVSARNREDRRHSISPQSLGLGGLHAAEL